MSSSFDGMNLSFAGRRSDEGNNAICPACLDHVSASEALHFGCHHLFCRGCMQRLVVEQMPLPQCPMPGCSNHADEDIIRLFVAEGGVAAFNNALLSRALELMPGRLECPNPLCRNIVVRETSRRQRWECTCGRPPLCSECKQNHHYHSQCGQVQTLRERWLAWVREGRERHTGLQVGFDKFAAERAAMLEAAGQRHKDLEEDENYKAQNCRLCPSCFRVVEKLAGCDSMRCGENWHGGGTQQGCGKTFNWSQAPKYQKRVDSHELPSIDTDQAILDGAGCRHLFTRCAVCTDMIRGPRFRCIHCEDFDLCLKCENLLMDPTKLPHPADHVFEILYAPNEPPIGDLPKGTSVAIFGLVGPGVVLNGCSAKVRRYNPNSGLYELELVSGSRVLVPMENTQPEVDDPSDAQSILEVALAQRDVASGFHFGIQSGAMVQVVSHAPNYDNSGFLPLANVCFYDPLTKEYCLEWEEPPQWACTRCTLLNVAQAARCAACDAAAPLAYGRFRVPAQDVQPLVATMQEAKNIAQRHWSETRRAELVSQASSMVQGCCLDIPPNVLVKIIDVSVVAAGQSGFGTVAKYLRNGSYVVTLRNEMDITQHGQVSLQVTCQQLIALLAAEDEPLAAAERIVDGHRNETARLEKVWHANERTRHCHFDLPPKWQVKWLSQNLPEKHDGHAVVALYNRDGTYLIQLRDSNGGFTNASRLQRLVMAEEIEPVFFDQDDLASAVQDVEHRHCKEAARLSEVHDANKSTRTFNLGIKENSLARWFGTSKPRNHDGCCLVKSYGRDASYVIHLRGPTGEFTDPDMRRWVNAVELEPLHFYEENAAVEALHVEERHHKEFERLKEIRTANQWAQHCATGFPSGTRIESYSPACPWVIKSSHKTFFLRSWQEISFAPNSLECVSNDVVEVQTHNLNNEPRTEQVAFATGRFLLRAVFWDEVYPMEAAKRIMRSDASCCAKGLMKAIYQRCSQTQPSSHYPSDASCCANGLLKAIYQRCSQAQDEASFIVGDRVVSSTQISFNHVTLPVHSVGTVVEASPNLSVNFDAFDNLNRSEVFSYQIKKMEFEGFSDETEETPAPARSSICLHGDKVALVRQVFLDALELASSAKRASAPIYFMDVRMELRQSLQAYRFSPTISQKRCLPLLMEGRSTFCAGFEAESDSELAETYTIPALQKICISQIVPQVLILVPCIECGEKVRSLVIKLGAGLQVQCCTVARGARPPECDLDTHHVIVGTVRQVSDLLASKSLRLNHLNMLVLHESDGAIEHTSMCSILAAAPRGLQCCLFSARKQPDLYDIMRSVARDEVCLLMNQPVLSMEKCRHFYVAIEREEWKLDTLMDMLEMLDNPFLVYCNSRRKVDFVVDQLGRREVRAVALHSDMTTREREQILREFRRPTWSQQSLIIQNLVDLPRDFDYKNIATVNYDLPIAFDDYLHRIGRPYYRYGRMYAIVNFVTNNDVRHMKDIEKHFTIHTEELPMDIEDLF